MAVAARSHNPTMRMTPKQAMRLDLATASEAELRKAESVLFRAAMQARASSPMQKEFHARYWEVRAVLGERSLHVMPPSPVRRTNPEPQAAEVFAEFHKLPAEHVTEITEDVHYHEFLAEIGDLVELEIITESGYGATLVFQKPRPKLAIAEDRKSLYAVGGDQSLDLAALHMDSDKWQRDIMLIGRVKNTVYKTAKEQSNYEQSEFGHKSREGLTADGTKYKTVSDVDMVLLYDTRSKLISFAGWQVYANEHGLIG